MWTTGRILAWGSANSELALFMGGSFPWMFGAMGLLVKLPILPG
jgi:hypothetical protein